MATYIQTNKDLNSRMLKKKYFKKYKIGQKLHIVDFDLDKSYLGILEEKSLDNLIIRVQKGTGYIISVSWQDLHCEKFGINHVIRW